MDAALLIARLIIGLGLAAHGMQKLLGWFSGYGLKGTAGFFESIGLRPGLFFAVTAGPCGGAGGPPASTRAVGPPRPGFVITPLVFAGLPPSLPHGALRPGTGCHA